MLMQRRLFFCYDRKSGGSHSLVLSKSGLFRWHNSLVAALLATEAQPYN